MFGSYVILIIFLKCDSTNSIYDKWKILRTGFDSICGYECCGYDLRKNHVVNLF